MSSPIAIVGAGGWGTALAVTMARAERRVRLWVHEPGLAVSMTEARQNDVYLPSVRIPDQVHISNSLPYVLDGASIVIIAAPSHVYRSVVSEIAPLLRPEMVFVSATKGIENQTRMRMSEIIQDVVGGAFEPRVAVISGPTFAPEVVRGEPAALVVASPDSALGLRR
jgi:glycerol-3-phosphate dehydrogenase (NAD(P)+)